MNDNVVRILPKKYDSSKVDQFAIGWARTIEEREAAERPTNILVIEMYKKDGYTGSDIWIGGPVMDALTVAGLLELVKSDILVSNYMGQE